MALNTPGTFPDVPVQCALMNLVMEGSNILRYLIIGGPSVGGKRSDKSS